MAYGLCLYTNRNLQRMINMKIYSLLTIWFVLLAFHGQAQKSRINFKDEAGKFKISFPIEPRTTQQTGDTQFGTITTYSFRVEPPNDDNLSYDVHYLDYPEAFVDTLSKEEIFALFNGSQTSNFNSEDMELLGTFNHQVLGYPGREFRWHDMASNKFSRVRFFMVKNRMYLLAVNTEGGNNFNVSINQFFDSFELIDTEPNPDQQSKPESVAKVFEIKFPQATEIREVQTPSEYGETKVVAELYQPKLNNDDNLIYMVTTLEYPKDITQEENFDLEAYYTTVVDNALAGRQSSLISKTSISQNGISGIEVKESFRGGQVVIKYRTFLKGNLQIGIQVMTIPSNDENASMKAFFDSFKFIEN
jgi:hypothetical protein